MSSKSHPEDALGKHSKASQKLDSSQPGTTSTNIDETKGGVKKVKPAPAHVGHANPHPKQEGDGVHSGVKTAVNRSQEAVGVASATRVQQARSAGPHGAQIDSQGNTNDEPKKHPPTTKGY